MRSHERKFIFIHILLWMALLFSYEIVANLIRYFFIGFELDLKKVWFLAEGIAIIILSGIIVLLKYETSDSEFLEFKPMNIWTIVKYFTFFQACFFMLHCVRQIVEMNSLNSFWNVIFYNLKHFNFAKIFNHYDKNSAIEIFLYLTLPLGILMPFFEELVYRGLIYRRLKEYFNRLTAMILLSFSLAILRYAHIIARDPRLLSPTYEEKVFAGISVLLHSFMMIYTYEKTKNFWTIVIISIVNSLITYHFTEHIFVVIGLVCIFASIVLLCHRLLTKNKTLTK